MTERLYFHDSHLTEFTATVLSRTEIDGRPSVVLDRTAFYPTGGGQPHDTGMIDGAAVVDVVETDDGTIHHVIGDPTAKVGDAITGRIDWSRRLDHLQQHTGQHILSQAFVQVRGAETKSFHLTATSATIDIELDEPTPEIMAAVEEAANSIIFENRPVAIHRADAEEQSRFPLRKESRREGILRIIEVAGFDWSPCGGTHAKAAGEVGLIVIRGWERAKRLCRVEFLCGGRALRDYRQANRVALATAQQFSAARDATPELVANLIDENKQQARRIRDLLQIALETEAAELLAQSLDRGQFRLVQKVFAGRDIEELKLLAQKITRHDPQRPAIALLATTDDMVRLVFAKSEGLPQNMGQLLGQACKELGGRGGGKPELAQGGGTDIPKLPSVLDKIAQALSE